MRLTVHVAEAKKQKIEVPSKEKPGTFVKKEVLYNTLSFTDVKEDGGLGLGAFLTKEFIAFRFPIDGKTIDYFALLFLCVPKRKRGPVCCCSFAAVMVVLL